jgi:hypothetical protein
MISWFPAMLYCSVLAFGPCLAARRRAIILSGLTGSAPPEWIVDSPAAMPCGLAPLLVMCSRGAPWDGARPAFGACAAACMAVGCWWWLRRRRVHPYVVAVGMAWGTFAAGWSTAACAVIGVLSLCASGYERQLVRAARARTASGDDLVEAPSAGLGGRCGVEDRMRRHLEVMASTGARYRLELMAHYTRGALTGTAILSALGALAPVREALHSRLPLFPAAVCLLSLAATMCGWTVGSCGLASLYERLAKATLGGGPTPS